MIRCRLMATLIITIFPCLASDYFDDPSIPREVLHVNVGKRIRMECEFNSSLLAHNRKGLWLRFEDAEIFFYAQSRIYRDERFQIEQRSRMEIMNSSTLQEISSYSLIIDDVQMSDDGTYSCQADNQVIKIFRLNIVERPYFTTEDLTTLYQTETNQNLTIECKAQGKPNPSISWMKKIDENDRRVLTECSSNSSVCPLALVDVKPWHIGIYECLASNPVGTISRFYEVDVHFPPKIYSSTRDSFNSLHDQVHLECIVDSNPEPIIDWFHRSSTARNGSDWFIRREQFNATRWKTTLFIQRLRSHLLNSVFICRAKNFYGEDEKQINVVQTAPIGQQTRSTSNKVPTTISSPSPGDRPIQQSSNDDLSRSQQIRSTSVHILMMIQLLLIVLHD